MPDPKNFINPWTWGCLIRSLAWLRQTHSALPLPAPAGDPRAGIPLVDLFVPPRLAMWPSGNRASDEGTTDLLDVLDAHRQVAILAEPGTGRTTLLAWLIHGLTDPTRNPIIDRLGRLVPVVIPLRALELDKEVRYLDLLLMRLEGLPYWYPGMEEVLPELLERGQVLFVIDDLDAVEDPEIGDALREAILDGMWRYPACTWILTAEPGFVGELPVVTEEEAPAEADLPLSLRGLHQPEPPRLSIWHLQPLGDLQVRAFVHAWWAVATSPEDAGPRAEALLGAIARSEHGRRIARNPSMLALLCVVGTARGSLPDSRTELLDWLVAGWLSVLDNVPAAESIPMEVRRAWVEAVARAAEAERAAAWSPWIRAGAPASLEARVRTPPISFEQAIYLLRSTVRSMGGVDPGADLASRFVFGVGQRPGVLVARGGGLGFARADQQRFLAAVHLAADLVGLDEGEKLSDQTLQTLKDWTRAAARQGDLGDLFAVLGARPGLAEKVIQHLISRKNPRTLGELEDLGPLAAAIARGGAGLEVSPRTLSAAEGLVREAIQRWALERGRVPRWADSIETLREVDDLVALDLSDNPRITDIGPLRGKKVLSRLELAGCTGVADLSPLGTLPALRWADLRGCHRITELRGLKTAVGLRWLDLGGCVEIEDLSELAGLPELQALVLHGCTRIRDLGPLSALRTLRALVISDCKGIFDLSPLRRLPSGGTVWVQGSGVRMVPHNLRWTVIGL